ncbi:hypothetical protein [Antrihabitans sp. YC2-6]|uniref:hypothetical protein n=1 Tax=Antrihabitans sp. YC2-6 TaxID=2799498 RepID=UPI0018F32128|nr:hypothetical protein [Antrihabitans sp. YC2-6]MBJ8348219.1 hypothetical protein [Antrihabitans sp. YC2-6]
MNMPPRPGQHLPGPHSMPATEAVFADPLVIHAEVDALLAQVGDVSNASGIPQQAKILEQAHDLLVQALATVDKI